LEDLGETVQLSIRVRPAMALLLAHEVQHEHCPGWSTYHLLQVLLHELGGVLRLAVIDAPQENMPVGLLTIRQEERDIHQTCHPVDAIAMAVRMQVPLYATPRALRNGSWKDLQPWIETVKPEDFA